MGNGFSPVDQDVIPSVSGTADKATILANAVAQSPKPSPFTPLDRHQYKEKRSKGF
jgi:hypothetical protein